MPASTLLKNDQRPLAIAVMGPTASGKTAFAIELAHRHNGEIVSVDSVLVYRGLDIGAAKPDAQLQAEVPHHLLDVRHPWEIYSAADFAQDAKKAIQHIIEKGKLPILAGGTGLYFDALLNGLSPMPEANPEVRQQLAHRAETEGWQALHNELAQIDPMAAQKIKPTDPQRIQRALEVWYLTNKPISFWQQQPPQGRLPLRVLKCVVAPKNRAVLHQRIADRFDLMLDQGFMKEVDKLREIPKLQQHFDPFQLPAIRAVGYRQAWEYHRGEYGFDTFRDRVIFATRQLAKRQITWLRTEFDARWFDLECDKHQINNAITQFLHKK